MIYLPYIIILDKNIISIQQIFHRLVIRLCLPSVDGIRRLDKL